jgi:hypothetical protein
MPALSYLLSSGASDPIGRALASAAVVGGVMAELPCRFVPRRTVDGVSLLVTCTPDVDPARAAFHRERTLTAVQRLTLTLWTEGVAAVWEPAPLGAETTPDLGGDVLLGRVWCPGGE